MNNINDDELRFVASHYKRNCLDTRRAWRRLQTLRGNNRRPLARRIAVAASVVVAVGIAVAAGIIGYRNYMLPRKTMPTIIPADSATTIYEKSENDTTDVFRFDHTPINQVLNELSRHYNRQLTASDTTKSVSGEIEATSVEDAVDVLETTLGVKIEMK